MDTLFLLISLFMTDSINVTYHDCYFLRDSLVEVRQEPVLINDINGIFIPPNSIHLTLWSYDQPQHFNYRTTYKLLRLIGWERFRVFFIFLHELCHYRNYLNDYYPSETETDLAAEILIKNNFERLRKFAGD